MSRAFPYKQPRLEVWCNGVDLGPFCANMSLKTDLREPSDRLTLAIADFDRSLQQYTRRGAPLSVLWGFDGERTELFRGVVKDADNGANPLRIQGIDYNTKLNATKIRRTFQDETADGVIKAILAGTGFATEVQASSVEIERLPFFSITARQAIDTVTTLHNAEADEPFFDYIRKGCIYWGAKDTSQAPAAEFCSGFDVIRFEESESGLFSLHTFVTSALHSQVVTIDGERFFVVRAKYTWRNGGRALLGLEPCS